MAASTYNNHMPEAAGGQYRFLLAVPRRWHIVGGGGGPPCCPNLGEAYNSMGRSLNLQGVGARTVEKIYLSGVDGDDSWVGGLKVAVPGMLRTNLTR
jgi:hypothetical protein